MGPYVFNPSKKRVKWLISHKTQNKDVYKITLFSGMPNHISIIFHYVPRFYKENLPSNCDQKTKKTHESKEGYSAVPTLNAFSPAWHSLYLKDFSEVVEKKGQ